MKVKGEGTIAATPEEIWKVIFDPAFMSQVIPAKTSCSLKRMNTKLRWFWEFPPFRDSTPGPSK
jgi:carbon monoxide dehydrogenase subunit G